MFFSHKQLLRDEHVCSVSSLTAVAVVTQADFRVNTMTPGVVGVSRYEITNTCSEGLPALIYPNDIGCT